MTQNTERKVRTRDEQVEALAKAIGPEKIYRLLSDEYRDEIDARALQHILEAEARGAAEQQRKDAGKWASTQLLSASKIIEDKNANIAALEVRVEVLEGICRHVLWTKEEYGLGSRGHDSAVQAARAALAREGGT